MILIENYETNDDTIFILQNNMRWMSGLRECVQWIQAAEHAQVTAISLSTTPA